MLFLSSCACASATSSRENKGKWVALVSGLDLSSNDVPPGEEDAADIRLQMLVEYLKGESGGAEEQRSSMECIALIILGNSLDVPRRIADDAKNAVSLVACTLSFSPQSQSSHKVHMH